MQLSEIQKIVLNLITVAAWGVGIVISVVAAAKGRRMKTETGVSFRTYLILVGVTEVLYTIGAVMILSAMGINVVQHLARLEVWRFLELMSTFDLATIEVVGILGWFGFVLNRSISFLSPGYLLLYGGKRLPTFFFYSAWTEVGLETFLTVLIFASLVAK